MPYSPLPLLYLAGLSPGSPGPSPQLSLPAPLPICLLIAGKESHQAPPHWEIAGRVSQNAGSKSNPFVSCLNADALSITPRLWVTRRVIQFAINMSALSARPAPRISNSPSPPPPTLHTAKARGEKSPIKERKGGGGRVVREGLRHPELQYGSDSFVCLFLLLPDGGGVREKRAVLQRWGAPRGFLICQRMKARQITEWLVSLWEHPLSPSTPQPYLLYWSQSSSLLGGHCTHSGSPATALLWLQRKESSRIDRFLNTAQFTMAEIITNMVYHE
ncbi:hypothetical protein MHYP_G00139990 [Metynnis hypsauchen]